MVTLLLELLGLALVVTTAALVDWRAIPAIVGAYLLATARTTST